MVEVRFTVELMSLCYVVYLILGYIRPIIAFPDPVSKPSLHPEHLRHSQLKPNPLSTPPGAVTTDSVEPPALPGPSVANGSAPPDAHGSAEGVSPTRNVGVLIRNESLTF